jgi:PAS domain S-box-containing protein
MGHFQRAPYAIQVFILFTLYFITGKIGLSVVPVSGFAALAWPPAGLSLAALLLFGNRLWPGVALGALAVNLMQGAQVLTALGISIGNTAEALVGAFVLRRFCGFHASLDRIKDALAIVVVGIFLSSPISATMGTLCLWLSGAVDKATSAATWTAWWAGDGLSAVLIAPFLLVWGTQRSSVRMKFGRLGEAVLLFLLLCIACGIIFSGILIALPGNYPLAYLTFPFLIWAAIRFGQRGAVSASMIIYIFGIWGTYRSLPLYPREISVAELYFLQTYQAVSASTAMILASVIVAQKRGEEALLRAHGELERKVAERTEELHKNSIVFKTITESTSDFIVIKNLQGRYLMINSAVARFLGRSMDSIIGRDDSELLAPEVVPKIRERDLAIMESGHSESFEEEIEAGGGKRIFLTNKCPYRDNQGKIIGVIGIAQDITERFSREAERTEMLKREQAARIRAEEATRMRDELMAMVSHDLKNPLAGIITGTELIQKLSKVDEPGKLALAVIRRSTERMNRLIRDLLDNYRFEESGFNIQNGLGAHEVAPLLQESVEAQKILASDGNIRLEIDASRALPAIRVNPDRILQVLQNLIGNAIKFSPPGGVVRLKAERVDSEVLFSVKDNGPGIEESFLPHVFERFSRAKGNTQIGTGLGLSIAKGIVEAHGGTIWAESKQGEGSSFFFTLPVAEFQSLAKAA